MNAPNNQRLDSWKEIAAFFGRDERTVRRWEKERALPVYRMPGKVRGSVYAFTDELSNWLKAPPPEAAEELEASPAPDAAAPKTTSNAPVAAAPSRLWPRVAASLLVAFLILALWAVRHQKARAGNGAAPNGGATARSKSPASANAEAEDLYLKGRLAWSKRNPEGLHQAVDLFTQAIVHDPNFAQAYAGLADTYNLLREYTDMPESEAYPRALAAARKAVELDPTLSDAHRSLAFGMFNWEWDTAGAEREFQRAIELNPNDALAHHWYATTMLNIGRYQEARTQIEQARQLDPSSASIAADRGLILFASGEEVEAVAVLQQMEKADPSFRSPHYYLATYYLREHKLEDYLRERRTAATIIQNQTEVKIASEGEKALRRGGEQAMWEAILREQKLVFPQGNLHGLELAETCAMLGRKQEALQYLKSDFERHSANMVGIRNDMMLKNLFSDPQFKEVVDGLHQQPAR